jgi:hypothetical protein
MTTLTEATELYVERIHLLKEAEIALKKVIVEQSGYVVGDVVRHTDPYEDQTPRKLTWIGARVEFYTHGKSAGKPDLYVIAKSRKKTVKGWHSVENDITLVYLGPSYPKRVKFTQVPEAEPLKNGDKLRHRTVAGETAEVIDFSLKTNKAYVVFTNAQGQATGATMCTKPGEGALEDYEVVTQ